MTDATASLRFVPLAEDHRPDPKSPFDFALNRLLDDLFEAAPTWATQIGYHAFDDRWPDVSDAGREGRLAMLRHHRARLQALPEDELSPADVIDRSIALEAIDEWEFNDAELRDGAWDPLAYVYLAGSGLFNLLARDYAPWEHRGTAFLGRIRALPEMLEAAVRSLTGVAGRPVSLLHTETALTQLSGINELVSDGIDEARRQAATSGSGTDRALADGLEREAVATRDAIGEFERQLRDVVAPRASGEGRLGPELFQQKLRHTLASDLSYEEIEQRARHDYDLVRAEMARLAREASNDWLPGQVTPDPDPSSMRGAENELIRRVLDAIAREHRQPHELLDFSRDEVRRVEAFCREHDIIGLPDEPLEVTWTPMFMRAYGRAFLHSPGPLDRGLSSYYWITPPDENLGPAAVESYLREDNDRMLTLAAIHEGVPGHYLQLAWSNRTPSLTRAAFQSGTFAEGWAVYVTQVMMDVGYGDFEPALLLNHWKFYLRAITNALMDVAIHTGSMTEEEAMGLMVGGGFQEDDEARAKWLRARLTATQLCTYYVGSLEMWDMEVEARQRAAIAAGASIESVPPQRIAGGLGETPGFRYRDHLESVISHGTPPIKWVRRILQADS